MTRKPLRRGDQFAPCFVPKGRKAFVIYAVVVKDHPSVVKIGRTYHWSSRRKSYATWNLSSQDAVIAERTFTITEDYVDLCTLEKDILVSAPFPLAFGREWFNASIEDAERHIDAFITSAALSFISA